MDIYDVLTQDHEEVASLFEKLFDTSDDAQKNRNKVFTQLKQELEAHTAAEEDLFYPLLQDHDETQRLAERALEAHQEVDRLLEKMSSLEPDTDEWIETCRTLHKNVESHVDDEENRIFPKARKLLSDEQAQELGRRTRTEEERFLKSA